MKTARKLTSLLLALLLVFALAATAAADGAGTAATPITGTITVDNPITNQEYKAYKIFDVVYDKADPQHYSYTIDSNNPWLSTVQNYNGLELAPVSGTNTTYIVKKLDGFSAPSFAETLKAAVDGKTGETLTKAVGASSATVSGLSLGYYFVTSSNGTLCNLTTTAPTVTIHDKNNVPFNKEGVTQRDVEVGKVLDYKITGKVPDTTGFETHPYTYEITDTMSEGLTFNKSSLTVKIGNVDETSNTAKCSIDKDPADNSYTFKVTVHVDQCTVGQPIEVTYTATVNEKAVAQVSQNEAVLKYSNKPGTDEFGTIKPEPHKVYSAQIEINKFWKENGTEKKLAGVGFKLYKEETTGTDTVKRYYQWDEINKEVKWVNDTQATPATEVVTTADGKAHFNGLANGTYYLVESTTPAGFNPLEKPEPVTVEMKFMEDGKEVDTKTLTVKKEIENKTGAVLPSTGGMGTTVFYVLGAVLVVGAGVLLVTKKRMSRSEG